MKKIIIFLLMISSFLIIFSSSPKTAFAKEKDGYEELIKIVQEELLKLDLTEIDGLIKDYDINLNSPNFKDYLLSIINGNFKEDSENFFKYATTLLFSNINQILPNFISILIIAVLYKLIENFSTKSIGIKNVVFYALNACVIVNLYSIVAICFTLTKSVITRVNGFLSAIMPVLLTLIIASGGKTSATVVKPTAIFLSGTLSQIISSVVLPIVEIIILINLVSSLSKTVNLTGISNFFNSLIKWILGIGFTAFTVFTTVQGVSSSNIDLVTLKTAQYTVSNGVPIIGGYLSGGISLVLAGSILIKNAVGVGAVVILFAIILSPLLYIIAVQLLLKGFSAVVGLICESKISETCTQLSKSISLLITVIAGVAFMLFSMLITILITSGSAL